MLRKSRQKDDFFLDGGLSGHNEQSFYRRRKGVGVATSRWRQKESPAEIEIETKFVNEGFIQTSIEPRKPDTKFREAETEVKAGRKKYYEAEAEAESIKNSI